MPLSITTPVALDDETRARVHAFADAIERRDGEPPLSDQALTHLVSGSVTHVVAHRDGELAGYAQLDRSSLEIASVPEAIPALLDAVDSPDGLLVWSHGKHSPIAPVLEARGFRKARILHQLRRPLTELPEAKPADGIAIRSFVAGQDETAWLAVNATAFAHHPEQGHWTREDLAARQAEPWWDPAGFLLAERDGRLVGFHWTKIHADGTGEVYVLGVDPAAQGSGLGPALLRAGMAYLAGRGCPEILLYVDDDNSAALRIYERAGFHQHDTDIQWSLDAP